MQCIRRAKQAFHISFSGYLKGSLQQEVEWDDPASMAADDLEILSPADVW